MIYANPDGNGGYNLTWSTNKAVLRDLVDKLVAQGITRLCAMPTMFVIAMDYKNYHCTDGNWYSAIERTGTYSSLTGDYWDAHCIPDPVTEADAYQDFLDIQYEFYRMMATEFPEIKYWETVNEPEGGASIHRTGAMYYESNSALFYTEAESAKILMDISYYATLAVKSVNAQNRVLSPALTCLSEAKTMLTALYAAINDNTAVTGKTLDKTIDNYFEILNWHPYVMWFGSDSVIYDGTNSYVQDWIDWQNDMYNIAVAAGDSGVPVWFTEVGFSDCGSWGNKSPISGLGVSETLTANIFQVVMAYSKTLGFVQTFMFFRLNDYTASGEYAVYYEGNFGLVNESGAMKLIAQYFYQAVNNGSTDYSAVLAALDKYHD